MRCLKWEIKDLIGYNTYVSTVVAVVLLFIVLLCSIDRRLELKDVTVNPLFWTGWILCFSMILLTSLFNKVYSEYIIWGLVSLFITLPFALIWSVRSDYEVLCIKFSRCILAASGAFFLLNLLIVPFMEAEQTRSYCGLVGNSNTNGTIVIGASAAAMFLLLQRKQRPFVCLGTISFCVALAIASNCRTALLAITLETFIGYVYFFKNTRRGRTRRIILSNTFVCLIAVIIMTVFILIVLQQIRMMSLGAYALDSTTTSTKDGNGPVFTFFDNMLSGRLRLWRAFIADSTFWGNGTPTKPVMKVEASMYAHNHAIEILYTSGVPACAGFVLYMLSGLIFVVRCLKSSISLKREYLLTCMAFIGCFIYGMFEVMTYPTSSITSLMMYICIVPLATKRKEKKQKQ